MDVVGWRLMDGSTVLYDLHFHPVTHIFKAAGCGTPRRSKEMAIILFLK